MRDDKTVEEQEGTSAEEIAGEAHPPPSKEEAKVRGQHSPLTQLCWCCISMVSRCSVFELMSCSHPRTCPQQKQRRGHHWTFSRPSLQSLLLASLKVTVERTKRTSSV